MVAGEKKPRNGEWRREDTVQASPRRFVVGIGQVEWSGASASSVKSSSHVDRSKCFSITVTIPGQSAAVSKVVGAVDPSLT